MWFCEFPFSPLSLPLVIFTPSPVQVSSRKIFLSVISSANPLDVCVCRLNIFPWFTIWSLSFKQWQQAETCFQVKAPEENKRKEEDDDDDDGCSEDSTVGKGRRWRSCRRRWEIGFLRDLPATGKNTFEDEIQFAAAASLPPLSRLLFSRSWLLFNFERMSPTVDWLSPVWAWCVCVPPCPLAFVYSIFFVDTSIPSSSNSLALVPESIYRFFLVFVVCKLPSSHLLVFL